MFRKMRCVGHYSNQAKRICEACFGLLLKTGLNGIYTQHGWVGAGNKGPTNKCQLFRLLSRSLRL